MDDIKDVETQDETEAPEPAEKLVNRLGLLALLMEKSGLPRGKAMKAMDTLFEVIGDSLKEGKAVRVAGFGAFAVAERKATTGRNPRTGEEIAIPESKSVRFRPGRVLRDKIA